MDYYTHIENCPYMRWQADLLYESLQMLGLGDSFVLAYSQPPGEYNPPPEYPRVFEVQNIGAEWNCVPANKQYGLYLGVLYGVVRQPVIQIDPDVFVLCPVEVGKPGITGQYSPYLQRPYIEQYEGYGRLPCENWYPVSGFCQFNDVPVEAFRKIVECCKVIAETFPPEQKKLRAEITYWMRDMVGQALGISLAGVPVHYQDYESSLDHRLEAYKKDMPMVHYCNHYAGHFYKRLFDERIFPDCPKPWEMILQIPDENEYIVAFKAITRSFLNRKGG
jgi:hypothetical protein